MANRTCSVDGCEKPHLARGYCDKHYRSWRLYGDPVEAERRKHQKRYAGVQCKADGCERQASKRGLCNRHYRRWWLYGDAEHPLPQRGSARATKRPLSPSVAPVLSALEAAWLAGLFEGEGAIILLSRTNSARLAISMTDRDVIERVNSLVPMPRGVRHRPWKEKPHHKEQWAWYANDGVIVQAVLQAMLPWLGDRRRARAQEALAVLAERKPKGHYWRSKTHCPKGHPYDETNTVVNDRGQRSCRQCRRDRSREFEQRVRAERLGGAQGVGG